jgi:hypothetical protein
MDNSFKDQGITLAAFVDVEDDISYCGNGILLNREGDKQICDFFQTKAGRMFYTMRDLAPVC